MKTILILLALSLTGCATAISMSPLSSCQHVKYERTDNYVELSAECSL
jgi:hypothetical protein